MSVADDDPDKRRALGGPAAAFVFGGFPMAMQEVTVAATRFRPIPVSAGTLALPLLGAGAIGALWNPPGDPRLRPVTQGKLERIDPADDYPIEGGLATVTVSGTRPPSGPVSVAVAGQPGAMPDWTKLLEQPYTPDIWDKLYRFGITRQLLRSLKNRLARGLPRVGKLIERLLRESRTDDPASVPRSVAISADSPTEYQYGTSADLSAIADPSQLAADAYASRRSAVDTRSAAASTGAATAGRNAFTRQVGGFAGQAGPYVTRKVSGIRPGVVPDWVMKAQPQLQQLAQSLTNATPSKTGNCKCDDKKPKEQKKKKRQPRAICYRGTYTQRSKGIIYRKKEQVPCQ